MATDDQIRTEILTALDAAFAGNWDRAHAIVQRHEAITLADWLHAVLHRIEGDKENAAYWYARAGRDPHAFETAEAELAAIAAEIGHKPR